MKQDLFIKCKEKGESGGKPRYLLSSASPFDSCYNICLGEELKDTFTVTKPFLHTVLALHDMEQMLVRC